MEKPAKAEGGSSAGVLKSRGFAPGHEGKLEQ